MDFDVILLHLSEFILKSSKLVVNGVGDLLLLNCGVVVNETSSSTILSIHLSLVALHVLLQLFDLILKLINFLVHVLDLLFDVLLLAHLEHLLQLSFLTFLLIDEVCFDRLESSAHLF